MKKNILNKNKLQQAVIITSGASTQIVPEGGMWMGYKNDGEQSQNQTEESKQIKHEKEFNDAFKAIIDANPLCLNLWNRKMENLLCNKQAVLLFDLESEDQYLKEFFNLSPEYQPNGVRSSELAAQHVEKAFSDGYTKFRWLHQNLRGVEIPTEIILSKILVADNEELVVGFTRDLRSEIFGSDSNNEYENYFLNKISDRTLIECLTELTDEWFFALDTRTSIIQYYGKQVKEYSENNSYSMTFGSLIELGIVHEDDKVQYDKLVQNIKRGYYEPIDIRYKQKNGNFKYYRYMYQSVKDSEGNLVFVVGKSVDVHEQKMLEERSKVDWLTGCYNKMVSEHIVAEILLKESNKQHALFIVDIDNFKAINDNLGHYFGDEVLKEISLNLRQSFRNQDIVARIGGDEFTVFMSNISSREILEEKAAKIMEAFSRTYSGEYKNYSISGSVGVAIFPEAGNNYVDLYKSADKALYEAKMLGKNRYVFYDESLIDGTMKNITKIENADRMAAAYFDYDLINAAFETLYDAQKDQNTAIDNILQYVCKKYNIDRCYIFETNDEGGTYNNTFEQCLPNISKEIDSLQGLPGEMFEDLFSEALHNGIVYTNNLEAMFKAEGSYETMANQGIKSFAHAQVRKGDYVSFFLGVDDCTKARVWSEKEINTLQYLSKFIALYLHGNTSQEKK